VTPFSLYCASPLNPKSNTVRFKVDMPFSVRKPESDAYQSIEVKESEGEFTDPGRIQYKGERHHLTATGLSGRVKGFSESAWSLAGDAWSQCQS
jgi:hypothetical protein